MRAALALVLALAVGACVQTTADYCASDSQCASQSCNHRFMRCNPMGGTLDPDGLPHLYDAGDGGPDVAPGEGGTGGADGARDTSATCAPACSGAAPVCDTANLTCVGCLASGDCTDPAKPVCDTTAKICVGCVASKDCGDPTKPACDTTAKTCVGCLMNADCLSATAPICDTTAKTCAKCATDAQCAAKDATKPACDTTSGTCFPCVDSKKHCPATAPICDANAHACRTCQADAECATAYGADPGLCLDANGQCATNDQTIYLQNGSSCSTTVRGDGTVATPFCFPNDATAALSIQRPILIVRGPRPVDVLTIGFAGSPVVVAGQAAATLGTITGTPSLITVTGGDVTLRDLNISNGPGPGISATGGTLRVLRCLVTGNAGAGIQTTSAGFDIENTVIAKNGGMTDPGAKLGATTTSPTTFRNNTVVENGFTGIVCGSAFTIAGSIVFGNGTTDYSANCVHTDLCATGCSAVNPMVDETANKYQLTSSSPAVCIDVLDSAPPTDRKGTPRPQGPKSDCGADEWMP